MSTAKDIIVEILSRQPEDSSYDELLRELALARMVQRGLEDSDAGRTLSNDEVKSTAIFVNPLSASGDS